LYLLESWKESDFQINHCRQHHHFHNIETNFIFTTMKEKKKSVLPQTAKNETEMQPRRYFHNIQTNMSTVPNTFLCSQ